MLFRKKKKGLSMDLDTGRSLEATRKEQQKAFFWEWFIQKNQ